MAPRCWWSGTSIRAGLLHPEAPPAVIKGIRAWSAVTTIMFAVSIPIAFVAERWVMIAWPVGYIGLRVVAEFYDRTGRSASADR